MELFLKSNRLGSFYTDNKKPHKKPRKAGSLVLGIKSFEAYLAAAYSSATLFQLTTSHQACM